MGTRWRTACAASVVLVALASACRGGGDYERKKACAPGQARPIAASQLVAALRANGVSAYVVPPAESLCGHEEHLVANVSNSLVSRREGLVSCGLYDRPLFGPRLRKLNAASADSTRVVFDLKNVECFVYSNRSRGRANVGAVRRAILAASSSFMFRPPGRR